MKRAGRMGAVAAIWLAAALVATLATMVVAASPPGGQLVRLESGSGTALAFLDSSRRPSFAPLSPEIVSDLLGPGSVERFFAATSGPTVLARRSPRASTPAPDRQEAAEREIDARPILEATMTVDRAKAAPGETLRYVITVRNVGGASAAHFSVFSHVPEHTTILAPPGCEGIGVEQRPDGDAAICGPAFPGPPGEHDVVVSFGPLAPGDARTTFFKVVVNAEAPKGEVIRNHCHVRGANVEAADSNEVSTRVT